MDIRLRPIAESDALTLYRWQRDPATRRYARNPAVPNYGDHCRWLDSKIDDPDCTFRMILADGRPAGTVRLDRADGIQEISINVAPDMHRQGIGAGALRLIGEEAAGSVVAEVHPDNEASHALFTKAGWLRVDVSHYRMAERMEGR